MSKTGFCFQNLKHSGIAPRKKLPLPRRLADIGFLQAWSHLPSSTGAQCIPLYGKEPSLLHQHSWTKLVFLFQNARGTSWPALTALPRALPGSGPAERPGRAGHGWGQRLGVTNVLGPSLLCACHQGHRAPSSLFGTCLFPMPSTGAGPAPQGLG